mmetsp:Transcript_75364/g.119002  ORF Transcript_75364/g.119002 Transcript_75364/m.119002 type:complete len:86 (+) Transcript_75364:136-393(+)
MPNLKRRRFQKLIGFLGLGDVFLGNRRYERDLPETSPSAVAILFWDLLQPCHSWKKDAGLKSCFQEKPRETDINTTSFSSGIRLS